VTNHLADEHRTFARDAKAVHEREQALRLLRAVITLPPPTRSHRTASLRYHTSPARSRPTHSRHGSARAVLPGHVVQLLACRVPLTDGLVRAIVSAAENPDDAMRIVCMETLVEIGASGYDVDSVGRIGRRTDTTSRYPGLGTARAIRCVQDSPAGVQGRSDRAGSSNDRDVTLPHQSAIHATSPHPRLGP
jgi:hypothetical protein